MALPPVLSEKGLAKFRTKLCERLLATGSCSFGDKCQYSHTERPRRNPHKVNYVARLCATPDNCPKGADCNFAHTRDEELYHPSVYKTSLCPGGGACTGYYCPFAHSNEELRSTAHSGSLCGYGGSGNARSAEARASKPAAIPRNTAPRTEGGTGGTPCVEVESVSAYIEDQDAGNRNKASKPGVADTARRTARGGRGARGSSTKTGQPQQAASTTSHEGNTGSGGSSDIAAIANSSAARWQGQPDQPSLESAMEDPESKWWYAGDQGDLRVCVKEIVSAQPCDGDALVGGIIRPGLFMLKPGVHRSSEREVRCQVKLMTISRGDSQIAAQVVKEAKRWIAHWSGMEQSAASGSNQQPYVLRRTVATTVLALPESASTLALSATVMRRSGSVARHVSTYWPLVAVAASWARQLVTHVQSLHTENISHLCLGPQTIIVNAAGDLHIGDFMGKIRALRLFESGWRGKSDDAWAMWYPPEVHRCVSAGGEDGDKLDKFRIDSWQLGVAIFYLLTGEHPFGDRRKPSVVCANVVADRRVNRPLLDHLPLFTDLISRLTERCPEQRVLPWQVVRHPVLWTIAESLQFSTPLLKIDYRSLFQSSGSLIWSCLLHIPALAVLSGSSAPAEVPGCLEALGKLCDKAISTNSIPVIETDLPALGRLVPNASTQPSARKAGVPHESLAPAPQPLLLTLPSVEQGLPAEVRNWQGSTTTVQASPSELLRAPPGLEEWAEITHSKTIAAAMPCHHDPPMFGAQPTACMRVPAATAAAPATALPATSAPPTTPCVTAAVAAGMQHVASPVLSFSELELLSLAGRTQTLPLMQSTAPAPSAPVLTDIHQGHSPAGILATGQPQREADGMLLAKVGVTGLPEANLGLVPAPGYEASSRPHPFGLHGLNAAHSLQASHNAAYSAMHSAMAYGSPQASMAAAAAGAQAMCGSPGLSILGGAMAGMGASPYLELPQYLQNLSQIQRSVLAQPHLFSGGHPSAHACSHTIYNHLGLLTGLEAGAPDPASLLTGMPQSPNVSVPLGYLPPALPPALPTAANSAALPPPPPPASAPAVWVQGPSQHLGGAPVGAAPQYGAMVKAGETIAESSSFSQWPMRVEPDPVAGGTRAVLTVESTALGQPEQAAGEQSLEAVEAKLEKFLSAWEKTAEAEEKENAEKLAKGVGGDGVSCLPADLLFAMEGASSGRTSCSI